MSQLSNDEAKIALRKILAAVRRHGFRVSDDSYGVIGLSLAHAITKWSPERGASLTTYATRIALRALAFHQRAEPVEFDDKLYMKPPRSRPYVAQELLLDFPEPAQSLGFAVWISRIPLTVAAETLGIEVHTAHRILDVTAKQLRKLLEDVP